MADLHEQVTRLVRLSDSLNNILELSENRVRVSLDVQEIAELTLDHIPIQIKSAPKRHSIILRPAHVSLTLRGGISAISTIDPSEFRATVDYNDIIGNPTGVLRPEISGPLEGVRLLQPVPARIRFVQQIRG